MIDSLSVLPPSHYYSSSPTLEFHCPPQSSSLNGKVAIAMRRGPADRGAPPSPFIPQFCPKLGFSEGSRPRSVLAWGARDTTIGLIGGGWSDDGETTGKPRARADLRRL